MRRRRILLLLAGCALVAFVLILLWPCEREPSYQGKSLSEWLFLYVAQNGQDTPQAASATVAVQGIGTNALPFLLEWLEYEPSVFTIQSYRVLGGVFKTRTHCWSANRKVILAGAASEAFEALGPEARAAIPGSGLRSSAQGGQISAARRR